MKHFFAFALLFIIPFFSESQTNSRLDQKIDSLNQKLAKDSSYIYRFRKWRPYVNYIERLSLGNPHTVNFLGPKLGLVYNERHIFALGAFFSSTNTKKPVTVLDGNVIANEKLNMTYGAVSYEYILIKRKYIEFPLPFEFGIGNYHANYSDSARGVYKTVNNNLILFSSGFLVRLKLTKYVGIIGAMGYRISNQKIISGFYYSYGIWVGLRKISNTIKYNRVKEQYRKDVKFYKDCVI